VADGRSGGGSPARHGSAIGHGYRRIDRDETSADGDDDENSSPGVSGAVVANGWATDGRGRRTERMRILRSVVVGVQLGPQRGGQGGGEYVYTLFQEVTGERAGMDVVLMCSTGVLKLAGRWRESLA
jgi:hypothetical protein